MKTRNRLKWDINVDSMYISPTLHINHFKRRLIRLINKTKYEVDFYILHKYQQYCVYEKIKNEN